MSAVRSLRFLFTALVYVTAIALGAGVFVVNQPRLLVVVPLVTGGVLLGHAAKSGTLDELGRAIMWLWAAVLAISVVGTVTEAFVLYGAVAPLVEIPVRVLGTFTLVAVLVAAYVRGVRGESGDEPLF